MKQTTSFWRRLFDCLGSGFVLSKTVLFISGLVLSHSLVQKAVVELLIYFLADLLSLRKAVVLINTLYLISAVFKFGIAHISGVYTSAFNVIIFCTAAYIMGLMLLWFRTWLILAIVLIALGKAGEEPSLRDFFDFQLSGKVTSKYSEENNRSGTSSNLWSTAAYFVGASIATFLVGSKSEIEWSQMFEVSSLVMGSAYLLFFFGIFCYYPEASSTGSPITIIYRVFMAAIQKRSLPYPSSKEGYYSDGNTNQGSNESEKRPTGSPLITTIHEVFKPAIEKHRILPCPSSQESYSSDDSKERPTITLKRRLSNRFSVGHSSNGNNNESSNNKDLEDPFYKTENGEVRLLPRDASFLSFLDKAAVTRDNELHVERDKKIYEGVCTAEQVRDVKSLYPLIPLAFTFFAYSLTFASGNTYFVLQMQNLDDKVGDFHVPVVVFSVLKSWVAFVVKTIQTIRELVKPTWSIAVGMFCSVLCCIAASLVERRRLHLIGPFKEEPEHIIPLSIMVLTPQYFLLGLMQGFTEYGLEAFLRIRMPDSMIKVIEPWTGMLLGIGNFSTVLFVLIFRSWIKNSLNNSNLGKYFLMMASLSLVFFGIYVCCARFKLLKLPQVDEPSVTDQETIGTMRDQLEDLVDVIKS